MTGLKQKLLQWVDPDLEAIESALVQNLNPHLELVHKTAGHLIFAGGKRLRPGGDLRTYLRARKRICPQIRLLF